MKHVQVKYDSSLPFASCGSQNFVFQTAGKLSIENLWEFIADRNIRAEDRVAGQWRK